MEKIINKIIKIFIYSLIFVFTGISNAFATERVVNLVVEYKTINFAGKPRTAIAVNNQIPAPTLHFKEGDHVTINVYNHLDQETAIHWHGMLVPWQMDGVLGITQQGIPPDGVFHYKFTLHQSGTYWYHAHAGLQEQQGLYGAFLIDPPKHPHYSYTKDYVVVLSDWSNTHPDQILANLKKEGDYYSPRFPLQPSLVKFIHDYRKASAEERQNIIYDYKMMQQMRMSIYDISDVAYDFFLLNGQPSSTPWTAPVKIGDVVRLRFIGAGGSTIFHVKIPGTSMQMVHVEGNDVKPYAVDDFKLAPGETFDVLVKIQKKDPYVIYAESIDTLGAAYGALTTAPGQIINYQQATPFPEPKPVMREMMSLMMRDNDSSHMNMNSTSDSMASMKINSKQSHQTMGVMSHSMKIDSSMKMNDDMKMDSSMKMDPNMPMNHSMDMGDQKITNKSVSTSKKKTASSSHTMQIKHNSTHTMDSMTKMSSHPSNHSQISDTMNMGRSMKMDHGMSMNHSMDMPTESSIIGDSISPPSSYQKTIGTKYQNLVAAVKTNDPNKPVNGVINMELFGYMDRFIWFINGEPEYKTHPIILEPNKRYRFIFTNPSMMRHPMHFHGHWFILRNGHGSYDPLLHTIDIPPGATVTADVDTDASGQWLFHCHLLYHMMTGMSRVFQYSTLIEITKGETKPQNIIKQTPYYNRPIVRVDEVRPIDVSLVHHPMAHPTGLYLANFLDIGEDPFHNVQKLTFKGLYGPDYNKLELFTNDAEVEKGKVENADMDIFYWHLIDQFWAIKGGANYFYRPAQSPYWQPGIGIEGLMPYFIDTNLRGYYYSGSAKLDAEFSRDSQITNNFFIRAGIRGIFASKTVAQADIGSGLNQIRYIVRPYYRLMPGLSIFAEYENQRNYGSFKNLQINDGVVQNTLTFGLSMVF
jgi:CopA family copper-resistance protein